MDILLVGPTGANVLVLSDVGGNNGNPNAFGPINLTLDDEAAGPLPINTTLSAGTFQPTDDDTDFPFSFGAIPQDNTGDLFPLPSSAPPRWQHLGDDALGVRQDCPQRYVEALRRRRRPGARSLPHQRRLDHRHHP